MNRADPQPRTPDARWADAIAALLAAAELGEDDEALQHEDSNNEMAPGHDPRRRCATHPNLRRV